MRNYDNRQYIYDNQQLRQPQQQDVMDTSSVRSRTKIQLLQDQVKALQDQLQTLKQARLHRKDFSINRFRDLNHHLIADKKRELKQTIEKQQHQRQARLKTEAQKKRKQQQQAARLKALNLGLGPDGLRLPDPSRKMRLFDDDGDDWHMDQATRLAIQDSLRQF